MCGCVMDDASSKQIATSFAAIFTTARAFVIGLFMLSAFSSGSGAAMAQDFTLEANVREIQEEREWIHVPVNKSVLIETNVPITREQTLAPEIAELSSISPTQVLVTGKSFGRTQVIIWSGDQRKIFDVSVELELDLLREAIHRIAPLADVQSTPIMDTVVLSGTVPDADSADSIMLVASIFASDVQNHLQVAGEPQVMLHVTFAEMSRSVLRQLGINGILSGENFRDFIVASNIGAVNRSSFGLGGGIVSQNLPFVTPGTTVPPPRQHHAGRVDLRLGCSESLAGCRRAASDVARDVRRDVAVGPATTRHQRHSVG